VLAVVLVELLLEVVVEEEVEDGVEDEAVLPVGLNVLLLGANPMFEA
jgi:hypothetical protein